MVTQHKTAVRPDNTTEAHDVLLLEGLLQAIVIPVEAVL
jgi:hypothetical protein